MSTIDEDTQRFSVRVSGVWTDPVTGTDSAHEETFQVLARWPAHAIVAGEQLFGQAAATKRFRRKGGCVSEVV